LSSSSSLIDKRKLLGAGGMRLVKQLFVENNIGEYDNAVYTMHREDEVVGDKVYPSLHRLYVESNDITEARFVADHLYDWQQWEQLANSHTYRDEIARWRTDLKAKITGELVDSLLEDAKSSSRSSKSSAKYLVDRLTKGKRGKPTTANIATNDEKVKTITSEVASDMKRLQLPNTKSGLVN
jgi:hypothetical protein